MEITENGKKSRWNRLKKGVRSRKIQEKRTSKIL
jgi:hypothetical protein